MEQGTKPLGAARLAAAAGIPSVIASGSGRDILGPNAKPAVGRLVVDEGAQSTLVVHGRKQSESSAATARSRPVTPASSTLYDTGTGSDASGRVIAPFEADETSEAYFASTPDA